MQRTIVFIKPDALQRGLVGEIVSRLERKGLKLIGIKMVNFDDNLLEEWYSHLKDKEFFPRIKSYIKWTPVVAMIWEGLEVIDAVRKIVGITKARAAEAGSIRGDLGMSNQNNLIHASDSEEAAKKEIGLIFKSDEIFEYKSVSESLIYSEEDL